MKTEAKVRIFKAMVYFSFSANIMTSLAVLYIIFVPHVITATSVRIKSRNLSSEITPSHIIFKAEVEHGNPNITKLSATGLIVNSDGEREISIIANPIGPPVINLQLLGQQSAEFDVTGLSFWSGKTNLILGADAPWPYIRGVNNKGIIAFCAPNSAPLCTM